jgi:hypothetical protein
MVATMVGVSVLGWKIEKVMRRDLRRRAIVSKRPFKRYSINVVTSITSFIVAATKAIPLRLPPLSLMLDTVVAV